MHILHPFVSALIVGLSLAGCNTVTPSPAAQSPTVVSPSPPVQGPAVLGDGVVIEDWQYFGPESVQSFPPPSTNVRDVGTDVYEAWLIWTDDGFDLVWGQVVCATQPVVVVHADAAIEFWPGESVPPDCPAMGVGHKLSVKLDTSIPLEQWRFTLHPPPLPNA